MPDSPPPPAGNDASATTNGSSAMHQYNDDDDEPHSSGTALSTNPSGMMSPATTAAIANENGNTNRSSSSTVGRRNSSSSRALGKGSFGEWRPVVGAASVQVSEFVNAHLVLVRYGVFASVGLLTAYGIMHTPLFWRYATVARVPRSLFARQKYLHGRLLLLCHPDMRAATASLSNNVDVAVTCYMRHLSPLERCMSAATLDWVWRLYHPAVTTTTTTTTKPPPQHCAHQLLHLQIAGIEYPSFPVAVSGSGDSVSTTTTSTVAGSGIVSSTDPVAMRPPPPPPPPLEWSSNKFNDSSNSTISTSSTTTLPPMTRKVLRNDWLHQLAEQRTPVTCQLLARRVKRRHPPDAKYHASYDNKERRQDTVIATAAADDDDYNDPVAIVRLYYRPKNHDDSRPFWQRWFATRQDVGETMVRLGHAVAAPGEHGLYGPHPPTERIVVGDDDDDDDKRSGSSRHASTSTTTMTTTAPRNLQRDAAYLERLARAEYAAARGRHGVWDNADYVASRRDVVDDVEFDLHAPLWKKVWRWVRDR